MNRARRRRSRLLRPIIQVVVSDVVMPGMGGDQLVERLRELRPDLPVILMSGYTEEEVKEGIRRKETLFLEKPFSADELLDAVGRAVSKEG